MESMEALDDGKWQEFDNFKDHYPPEFYAALLDKLNSKDVKDRRYALDELNKALDNGQFPGEETAKRVSELVYSESSPSMIEVAKIVQFECMKTRIEGKTESIETLVAELQERKRGFAFYSRPKEWKISDLSVKDQTLRSAAEIRIKINDFEKQKEDRWPVDEGEPEEPNEQTELRLLRRTIVLAFEELEALVPEMLTDDDRKTLAHSRKLAADRQAEHDAERAEVAAALTALKKWFPDCELNEDTATMNQVLEATEEAKLSWDAPEDV